LVKKLANGTERIDYTEINGQWERGIRYVASKYPDLAGVLVSGILDNEDGQAVGIRDANVVLGQYLQAIATQKGISLEVLLTDLKANKGIINDVLIPTKVQGIISGAVPTLYDGTDTRTIDFNKPLTIRILAKQEKEGIKEEIQKKYEFVELDKTTANLFYVDDEGRLMYAYEVGGDGYLEHSLLQSKGYNLFLTSNMLASAAHLDKNLVAEMQGGSQKTSAADGWIANLRMNVFNKGTQKFPIKPVGSLTDFAALPNGTGSAMLIPFQSTSAATH
jgi:hypothetical protein